MESKLLILSHQLLKSTFFQSSEKSIFQSTEIFQVWQKTKNYLPFFTIIENEKGEIIGSLFAVIQKEYKGFVGKLSSRSIIIGKPIYPKGDLFVLDALLKAYTKHVCRKAIYSQFRNLSEYSIEEKEIFIKNDFLYEPHLDIIHDLGIHIDKQFSAVHKGRRKNIRRAERSGVKFREIRDANEFNLAYNLVESTYKRIKLPMPDKTLFTESFQQLSEKKILKTLIAITNEEVIGCRMVLCYGDIVYDWYAGASNEHLDKYPNDFLPWKVMQWASLNGYKYFDFGGAGKPNIAYGVREHKLKFGGDLVEFGRFEMVHNKLLMKVGKIAFKLYKYIK